MARCQLAWAAEHRAAAPAALSRLLGGLSALLLAFLAAAGVGGAAAAPSAGGLVEKARELHKQGDLEGAKKAYKKAAKLSPRLGDTVYGQALIEEQQGLHEAALASYARAQALDPYSQAGNRAEELAKLVAVAPVRLAPQERKAALAAIRQVVPPRTSDAASGSGAVDEAGEGCGGQGLAYLRAWREALPEKVLDAIQEGFPTFFEHKNFNMEGQMTYWHPKGRLKKPRNAVELAIYKLRPLVPIPGEELMGAEWWPRRHVVKQGMNLHVDQDLTTDRRLQKFPAYSSILYLSDGGATFVLQQTVDPSGGLVPPVPHNSSVAYPVRGMFAVFDGHLVHGVVPPAEPTEGHREVLVVNWWRRKPSAPACNELPKAVASKHALGKDALKELAALSSSRERVGLKCATPQALQSGGHFSTFGNIFNVPLPVPSSHSPGQVMLIDWATVAARHDEL